jgi:hypothetical protein
MSFFQEGLNGKTDERLLGRRPQPWLIRRHAAKCDNFIPYSEQTPGAVSRLFQYRHNLVELQQGLHRTHRVDIDFSQHLLYFLKPRI